MAEERQPGAEADVAARVEELVERYAEEAEKGEYTMELSSGVEARLIPLPPLLVQELEDEFKEKPPPMVEVEVHGEKKIEPNPNDPDYIEELKRIRQEKGWAYLYLVLLKGVEIEMPEDEEWLEELRLSKIKVGDSKAAKRLAYLKSVISTVQTFEEVVGRVLAMSGVTPQAIDEAAKKVPG